MLLARPGHQPRPGPSAPRSGRPPSPAPSLSREVDLGWRGASGPTSTGSPARFSRTDGSGPGPYAARAGATVRRSWRRQRCPASLRYAAPGSPHWRRRSARRQIGGGSRGGDSGPRPLCTTTPRRGALIADSMLAAWRAPRACGTLGRRTPCRAAPTSAFFVRLAARSRRDRPCAIAGCRSRWSPGRVAGHPGGARRVRTRGCWPILPTSRPAAAADRAAGGSPARPFALLGGPGLAGPGAALLRLIGRKTEIVRRLDEATLVSRRWPTSPAQAYSRGHPFCGRRQELALMRNRIDQTLPYLIADFERTIGLSTGVPVCGPGPVRPCRLRGPARGHLNALGDVARAGSPRQRAVRWPAALAFSAAERRAWLDPGGRGRRGSVLSSRARGRPRGYVVAFAGCP